MSNGTDRLWHFPLGTFFMPSALRRKNRIFWQQRIDNKSVDSSALSRSRTYRRRWLLRLVLRSGALTTTMPLCRGVADCRQRQSPARRFGREMDCRGRARRTIWCWWRNRLALADHTGIECCGRRADHESCQRWNHLSEDFQILRCRG